VRRFSLALAFAAVLVTPALAADWRKIGESATGGEISVDYADVGKDSRFVTVHTKWGFDSKYPDQAFVISTEKYDCEGRVLSTQQMTTTFKDGRVDRQAWETDQWDPASPGTSSEAILNVVCASGFPR
jgi:opacity protein-like surface antigen